MWEKDVEVANLKYNERFLSLSLKIEHYGGILMNLDAEIATAKKRQRQLKRAGTWPGYQV